VETCLKRKEPIPEEMANVSVHPEDPNRVMHEETIRETEERSMDWCLTIRCRRWPKKWTQVNGGSQKKMSVPADSRSTKQFLHCTRDMAIRH
jgi:hypothetical protein